MCATTSQEHGYLLPHIQPSLWSSCLLGVSMALSSYWHQWGVFLLLWILPLLHVQPLPNLLPSTNSQHQPLQCAPWLLLMTIQSVEEVHARNTVHLSYNTCPFPMGVQFLALPSPLSKTGARPQMPQTPWSQSLAVNASKAKYPSYSFLLMYHVSCSVSGSDSPQNDEASIYSKCIRVLTKILAS